MKFLAASLSIGACLLLTSSGVVLTANLHSTSPSSVSGPGKGQTGSNHGNSYTPVQWPSAGSVSAGASGTAGTQYVFGDGVRCWICHRL
jgi:hypothetical protein